MPEYQVQCVCGKQFTSRAWNARYCSEECRMDAFESRHPARQAYPNVEDSNGTDPREANRRLRAIALRCATQISVPGDTADTVLARARLFSRFIFGHDISEN